MTVGRENWTAVAWYATESGAMSSTFLTKEATYKFFFPFNVFKLHEKTISMLNIVL